MLKPIQIPITIRQASINQIKEEYLETIPDRIESADVLGLYLESIDLKYEKGIPKESFKTINLIPSINRISNNDEYSYEDSDHLSNEIDSISNLKLPHPKAIKHLQD